MTTQAPERTAADVAEFFLSAVDESSGDNMTNLRLQKLLYYAQGWHLALLEEPLFSEDIQAATHGPVVRPLYEKYKQYGGERIPSVGHFSQTLFKRSSRDVLGQVWRTYGQFSAKRLEDMTHQERPWLEAREGCMDNERSNVVISHDVMWDYFRSVMRDNERRREYAHELAYMLWPETEEERDLVALSSSMFAERCD